ncbi:MAG: hypothetical protein ACTHK2_10130 [Dokdonella sp.]|uniref:hypothetical protein n=1 Tax=Dokdonella sp. TaxID=2291710 RepID=UPI003F80DC0D
MRVALTVDPHLESTVPCRRALRESGPALLMERPPGSDPALPGNLFGHRRRIENALGGGRSRRCASSAACSPR